MYTPYVNLVNLNHSSVEIMNFGFYDRIRDRTVHLSTPFFHNAFLSIANHLNTIFLVCTGIQRFGNTCLLVTGGVMMHRAVFYKSLLPISLALPVCKRSLIIPFSVTGVLTRQWLLFNVRATLHAFKQRSISECVSSHHVVLYFSHLHKGIRVSSIPQLFFLHYYYIDILCCTVDNSQWSLGKLKMKTFLTLYFKNSTN